MHITESKGFFDKKMFNSMLTTENLSRREHLIALSSQYTDLLWSRLSRRQLGRQFHRRTPVFGFLPAFWCPSVRLAVEVTDPAANMTRLAIRDRWLSEQGVTVVRLSKLEVLTTPEACVQFIKACLC